MQQYKIMNVYLKKNFPKHNFNNYSLKKYISILKKDKKNKNNKLGCILLDKNLNMKLTYKDFDYKLINIIDNYFSFKS